MLRHKTTERVNVMLNTQNTTKSSKGVSLAKSAKAPVVAKETAPVVSPAQAFDLSNGHPFTKDSLVAWCNANVGGWSMANLDKVKVTVLSTANMSGNPDLYKGHKLPFGYGKLGGSRAFYQDALLAAPTLGAFIKAVAGKQKGYNEFSTPHTVIALLNGGYGPLCRAGYFGTPFISLSVA